MATRRLVLGRGPDALRVAAVLAAKGFAVTLLQMGPGPSGLLHPDLPVDTGLVRIAADQRAIAERALGSLVEAPEAGRAVWIGGAAHALPLTPAAARRLLPPRVGIVAVRSLLRSRVRNRVAQLIGGGQEERTYADWVIRRMGGPAWNHLYAHYAVARFGEDPRRLAASAARHVHGVPSPLAPVLAGGPAEAPYAQAVALIESAGGEIRSNQRPIRIVVEGGKISAVELADGSSIPTGGPLWCTLPAAVLLPLLGDAVLPTSQSDAAFLQVRDHVQVALRGDPKALPAELHVLDERASFWRVTRPSGHDQAAIFHLTLPADSAPGDDALPARIAEEARAIGLGDFSAVGARVERLVGWTPVWRVTAHTRLRLLQLLFRPLGLIAVGRGGTFSPLDPGEEIGWAAALCEDADPDQRELFRQRIEPVGKVDDLDVSPLSLIVR